MTGASLALVALTVASGMAEASPSRNAEVPGDSAPGSAPADSPDPADSSVVALRTGVSLGVGVALGACVPNGSADCSNTYPGPSLLGSLQWRFWRLGLAVDFDHGWHFVAGRGAEEVSSTVSHVSAMLKGYQPLRTMEAFLGLGLGYSAMTITESSTRSTASWSTLWRGAKITGGVSLDMAAHGLPQGCSLETAASLFVNSGGTRCTEYGGAGPCLSGDDLTPSQRDVAHRLHLSGTLRQTF